VAFLARNAEENFVPANINTPFKQYFSYIVTVSFIVGESQPPAADY
jgi:hypothetical protein